MSWDPALNDLQAVLADLYTREADARRVAAGAGLDAAFIDFDGPAIDVWHQVLNEALNRDRVAAVITVTQQDYGDNAELAAAVAAFHAGSTVAAPELVIAAQPQPWRMLTPRPRLAIAAGVLVLAVIGVLVLRPATAPPGPIAEASPSATARTEATASPTATLVPSTATATIPPPTWTPARPTPFPAVAFVSNYVFVDPEYLTPTEYRYEPGILASETITDFLRLTRFEYGEIVATDGATPALSFTFAIRNTGNQPIALDLDQRFFQLVDTQGRAGDLVYFCCASRGELLAPDRVREIILIYRPYPGWFGKSGGASQARLEVRGLRPILGASWTIPLPVTAD